VARRSGLGKGLGALIPQEVSGDKSSALREIPLASIRPNSLQPRTQFDEESMAALAASIREVGVLQPVLVREMPTGEYELIAGERRCRASRRAGLQSIPALVQSSTDADSLERALVENLHRDDLGPLEEAAAYQQLVDGFGHTHEQVAARVGKSRTAVTNTLRLLQLPAGVQRFLADGAISAGHARALLGTPDRNLQEGLAKRTVEEGLSVRALEDLVRESTYGTSGEFQPPSDETQTGTARNVEDGSSTRSRPRLPAPGVLELEDLLARHLNTRVKVDMSSRKGRVVIEFATLEDLERIYKLMVRDSAPD
jgi:ParB family transcriptional regulator, chromosome partitioning protein